MNIIRDKQKRHEIKFVINSKEKSKFIIKNNLSILFPDRIVESIYFDTNDLKFFNLSEEGVTPRKKVSIKTPTKSDKELKIYSNKKVFLSMSKYLEVSSKKLKETVKIGIITSNEISSELKNQILNLFVNIEIYVV